MGAEARLGQVRPFGRPVFQQFKDGLPGNNAVLGSGAGERRGQQGSAVNVVRGLIPKHLNVGSISEYCTMWSDMAVFARKTGHSEAVGRTIMNVGRGLDYLAFTQRYGQIEDGHKTFILEDIPAMLRNEGTDRVVLSYEEGKLLQLAAAAVNITYDPGEPEDTPENIQKRTFVFADLERSTSGAKLPDSTKVVDAENS